MGSSISVSAIVSAIIVTFNRKNDVVRCIDAVLGQSFPVKNIVVVNNASTDGTLELLSKRFPIQDFPNVHILNLEQNTGGAGGFYTGLKFAHENLNSDFFFLMDDDGYPDKNCLELLLKKATELNCDYIMPVSLDIENPINLSWLTRKKNHKKTLSYKELRSSWGEIMDYVIPFNGTLLSKKIVDEVGYINKDFFIWGDDYEHYYRCKKAGFKPVTYLDAKFYHPAQKLSVKPGFFGFAPYTEQKLYFYCMIRNWTYIYFHYGQRWKIVVKRIAYFCFFIFSRHFDIAGWKFYKKAVQAGLKGDFSNHLEFVY